MTRPRRAAAAVVALVALAALAGCSPAPQPVAAPAPAAGPPTAAASPTTDSSATPRARADRGPQPIPADADLHITAVTVPAVGIRTGRLEELSLLEDGSLAAPKDPDRAGWFADGAVPGEVGPAVIAGHVDSTTGPAVFYDLARTERGDLITVGLSDGSKVQFRVDRVLDTAKKGFPTDAVFGPTPDAELRLITCSGPYDADTGYLDNTVVFATRTTSTDD